MIDLEKVGKQVLDSAMSVHTGLGPGMLESAYEACMAYELGCRHMRVQRQLAVPLQYKGVAIDCGYRLDLLVDDQVVLELKSVDRLNGVHLAQLLSYLRLGGFKLGYLLNFNVRHMKDGVKRIVN